MFRNEKQGAVDIVNFSVPLNKEHANEFREAISQCVSGQPKLVVNLADVPLIDSSGLEALLDLQEQVERLGGAVKLAAVGGLGRDALRATAVGDRFEMFETVKAAVGSYSR